MSIDLSKINLRQVTNTIIQFRVPVQTKILYIMLDTQKKRLLKKLVESAIEKLAQQELGLAQQDVEVRKVELDLNIQVTSDNNATIEKELEVEKKKLKLCEDELETVKKELSEYKKYKEKVDKLNNLINLLKSKTIDEKTFINQILKL